ncbi:type II 3-dehydroquinate dehydratase [Psychrobacter sp.]|uniref:type II 3-dehydroquinate dehydratase n=1 Tax=Psychrobacter sp. TaxID=56811 RepID=UPI0025FCA07E|nr:type II 3-dehydroquinate dehydratase [Psychrobacter sp.]
MIKRSTKSSTESVLSSPLHRRILLMNGPNLNLLGVREPEIYGHTTLQDIEERLISTAKQHNIEIISIQSNHEGELIDAIQYHGLLADSDDTVDAVIINPAAFTHTSVALRDALSATNKPFIEVHLSNIHSREPFRTHSYFSDKAKGIICGLGHLGYDMALDYFISHYYSA